MSTAASLGSQPVLKRFALFEYGFRPFFLLAGVYAAAMAPVWVLMFVQGADALGSLPPMYWHAHEMIYGFVGAAIAGFLLTAVPSWTGVRGFGGTPLMMLVIAWLGGRAAMASVGLAPFWITALVELAFLPLLAALLAPPLLRSTNRNTPLLAVIGILWLLDAAFLVALRSGDVLLAARATTLAIDFVLILVTVIGGRIVPSFTANALRRNGESAVIVSRRSIEILAIASMVAIAVVDVFAPSGALTGVLAGFAALVHLIRLAGWRSFKTAGDPILWILHVAYAWLPIGLALKAIWILAAAPWAMKWQHALTMGVFGTMILAVMTRASLGHTGRALKVSRSIALAYILLTLGVLIRVFGGALAPEHYVQVLYGAAAAWTLAFLIYAAAYAPILIGPRADGKAG